MRVVYLPLRCIVPAIALACLFGTTAFARDGVVEINQERALKGGVTPTDTPGFPVTLGEAGSYVLTGVLSIRDANTTAILVTVPDVTIDLNGFGIEGLVRCSGTTGSVTCDPSGTGVGIRGVRVISPSSLGERTTVRNGFVRGMGANGLVLLPGSHADGLLIEHNAGSGLALGADSLLTDTRVLLNGRHDLEGDVSVTFRGCRLARANLETVDGATEIGGNTCDDGLCSAVPKRRFYVTPLDYYGDEARSACEPGFHMASLWEIFDPSALLYDTTRGYQRPDSGSGPPSSSYVAWVRTGAFSDTEDQPGTANCDAWTSRIGYGSVATLVAAWTSGWEFWPWSLSSFSCDQRWQVWCVQD